MYSLSDQVDRKFIETFYSDEYEVLSHDGFHPILSSNKTVEYERWVLELEGGFCLEGADDHIVITDKYEEIFLKDCIPHETVLLTTKGPRTVASVYATGIRENMYDLSVDSHDHLYYTNDVLSHNTTTAVAIILHYVLFQAEPKTVALLANKGEGAREIMSRLQLAYENLPKWLQQGVKTWNKGSIHLENECKVITGTTTSSSLRGKSLNFLYIDEAAFIDVGWDDFFGAVYPTLSTDPDYRLFLTSTPNGLNHFYKIWDGAVKGKNGYAHVLVTWDKVPGRGQAWKEKTLQAINFDEEKFAQEYECEFQGSSGTLLDSNTLKSLVWQDPINQGDKKTNLPLPPVAQILETRIYEKPEPSGIYVQVVDVSRGKGIDFSAIAVMRVDKMPYRQVATYRSNLITPVDYAEVVYELGKYYNEALTMVEINDIGGQVSDILIDAYDYDNVIYTAGSGKGGKKISGGFGHNVDRGIRTTKTVKAIGCSGLKMLITQSQMIVNDFQTIEELSRFSKKGTSYEAEVGFHDDTVMCLVLFSWLAQQTYFEEYTDINTLAALKERSLVEIEEDLPSVGIISDGNEYGEADYDSIADGFGRLA